MSFKLFEGRMLCLWASLALCGPLSWAQQTPGSGTTAPAEPSPAATQTAPQDSKSSPTNSGQAQPAPRTEQEKQIEKKEQSQRIMGVYPQFSVTSRKNAPPLTPGGKFRLFYKSAFDPFEFLLAGIQAGSDQAENEFPAYGQGLKGFGKRYAADFTDSVSSGFFSNFFWPALLKEDPRYFRLGEGSFKHRFAYSLEQEFVCHTDKGGRFVNLSNILGALSSGALSNTYHPQADRGVGLTVRGSGYALFYGSLGGVLSEFWPDISKKMHRHKDHTNPADGAEAKPSF
jgi:hypothetical protein